MTATDGASVADKCKGGCVWEYGPDSCAAYGRPCVEAFCWSCDKPTGLCDCGGAIAPKEAS